MTYAFQVPTTTEFDRIFNSGHSLKGGGQEDISIFYPAAVRGRRGGGILSLLGGLAKHVAPFIMKTIAPEAVDFGRRVLGDVMQGENVRASLKRRFTH